MTDEEFERIIITQVLPRDPKMTPETRRKMVLDLKIRIQKRVDNDVIDALPDHCLDDLNALLEPPAATEEQIQLYVRTCGVDIDRIVRLVCEDFRRMYNPVLSEQRRPRLGWRTR